MVGRKININKFMKEFMNIYITTEIRVIKGIAFIAISLRAKE